MVVLIVSAYSSNAKEKKTRIAMRRNGPQEQVHCVDLKK